jgi:DNA-binding Lrp family transcriptional regulator
MPWLKRVKTALQKLFAPDEAQSFSRSQAEEAAFEPVRRGRQRVPLDRIVGSVGRYHDFDSRFRPKQHVAPDRYEKIKQSLGEGHRLPPVKLYQIRDDYFVVDGNHRIAAAKALDHSEIEADIVEFLPSKNTLENLLYRQRARFGERTGLPYNITLTEVGQYDYLLDQISRHQAHLAQTRGKEVPYADAAMDWYETIYRPLAAIIRSGNLLKFFPRRTLDDLYAYISRHQWEEGGKRKYGIGIDRLIPNNMEAFREKMANQHKDDYPEMLREITAFVLLNIRAKNEARILDKLFALKEVQEVHSIHGNVDVLTKIVLQRDLLSSDAEIISVFVNEQMRQIPGVISTQTLIPGHSKIKKD